jgi:hypothetical protein
MRRFLQALTIAFACATFLPATSQAAFGLNSFDVTFTNENGTMATQAGSHPFAANFAFAANLDGEDTPEGWFRDVLLEQAPGLVADATAYPRCTSADFLHIEENTISACPLESQIGVTAVSATHVGSYYITPVFNLTPPPGVLFRFGFTVALANVVLDVGLSPDSPYKPVAASRNTSQLLEFIASKTQLWGDPSDPAHDELRGKCGVYEVTLPSGDLDELEFEDQGKSCPVAPNPKPLLTAPTNCAEALESSYEAFSWEGDEDSGSVLTHDAAGNPQPFTGCGKLAFKPSISSKPTSSSAETGTGLDFDLKFNNEGLTSLDGLSQSHVKKAVVTLPQGVTINPSVGEGLGVCSPSELDRETVSSQPGDGCPNPSKIGSVQVQTPLLDKTIKGSVYLAQQDDPRTAAKGAENPFDSLIAFYIILQDKGLGISIKLPARVEPDPKTGQLVTTLEDTPQVPFSHFNFHFREGARAPLITPAACGTYTTKAQFTPWANPSQPVSATAEFKVTSGIGGGPCPPGGVPPFKPAYEAGSVNNNAGSFSPFYMRLQRADGEQDMTKFSSILPPGVLGTLKGVGKCADASIEAAKQKTGRAELASPSCPQSSRIGRTLAGAGVGGALTYVGGQIFLAGPYKGAPLSVVSITPAVAGPFDAGTVVVRLGLDLNPETAEVQVDGAASDPIPHILEGIVLKVRDLRVYVDRPDFTLNPTSCDESSAKATLFGSFLDVFSPDDDVAVELSSRYQASNCTGLGFKPNLKLDLRGGSKRGDHPGLRALLRARPEDANIAAAKVTLPRSAFLDQAHIRTICTRVQFAAEQCPAGSIYGQAKAVTPLLEEPLEGPVILRSSDNKLPDLVIALKGLVDVNVSSRIDSHKGGIRNAFESIPDAPVTSFTLTLQGGKKGLIVNSRNLCAGRTSRVKALFTGQNEKLANLRPKLQPRCGDRRQGK